MEIALPGARNMFGRLQNAVSPNSKIRVNLSKEVHQVFNNLWWIAKDLTSCPTCIAKLILLDLHVEGHHDALGKRAGRV